MHVPSTATEAAAEQWLRFCENNYQTVLGWSYAILRNEADAADAVQDLFIKLLGSTLTKQYEAATSEEDMVRVLRKVVTNHCRDLIRAKRPTISLQEVEAVRAHPGPDPFSYTLRRERLAKLRECLTNNLPPDQQRVVELRLRGDSNAEIAGKLRSHPKDVGAKYNLAVKNLKNNIEAIARRAHKRSGE
jgi:RNA polymerase sigma factor (sigma-70 family)